MLRAQRHVASAAEHSAAFALDGHEGSLALRLDLAQRMSEPAIEALWVAPVDLHPGPDDGIGRGRAQRLPVLLTNRLERDQPTLEAPHEVVPHQRSSRR